MPDITVELIDHIVFFVLVAISPWNGHWRFHRLTQAINTGDPNARLRFYRRIVIEKWSLAGVIAAAWIVLGRSAESIGLVVEYTELTPLLIGGFALTASALGGLLLYARSFASSEQMRAKTREEIAHFRAMVPSTAAEKRRFDAVSITAGITEELAFRGFLFAYLAALIPGISAAVVIVLAGLVFGLGHAYQGLSGIVKTGVLGVLFGVLYWMTGSVLAPMLVHVAVDLTSGWVSWQIVNETDFDDAAEPAAV